MNLAMLRDVELEAMLLYPQGTPHCGEASPTYPGPLQPLVHERNLQLRHMLDVAKELLVRRAYRQLVTPTMLDAPTAIKEYLRVHFAAAKRETFVVVFVDARSVLLCAEEMFAGTMTQVSVYPREIVRRSLELGAAGVFLAHNHPSGDVLPSRADEHLTGQLVQALKLIDVRVLDHFIVGRGDIASFSERGLL